MIAIGTGSAMYLVDPMIQRDPKMKVAVIDKDEPGGICLTRGCIPSKILLYPAELVRTVEEAREFGIKVELKRVDFQKVMARMRTLIYKDIDSIREGLSNSPNIDYYHSVAEFVSPYTLKVGSDTMTSEMIFLSIGSKAIVPPVKELEEVGYLTSDTLLKLTALPRSLAIVGGGYIAAEYGHFFSAMGSKVTIVGRNPQFLPEEEPEVSSLAKQELGRHMRILTDHEVKEARKSPEGGKSLVAVDRGTGEKIVVEADEILVAAGRGPTTDILHPERGGITTTKEGWIEVNEYLQTSQPNVWAFGDADGRYLFKHVANYETEVVYYNAILKQRVKVDYHAVPHAVFTYPEIASVGLSEKEAVKRYGKEKIVIGHYRYEDTAKGEAMNAKGYFVKVIIGRLEGRVLGAHIIGPHASILIQEVINVMYTKDGRYSLVNEAMHIHPSLSEVVQRAFGSLMEVDHYHQHVLGEDAPAIA